MSVLAQGNASSRGVEEDILVPLLARLTTISALLDSAADPATREGSSGTPPPAPVVVSDDEEQHDRLRAEARMLLEKVRREMVQLEDVFRRVDNAEKHIRYCFDPVERHLDEALQQEPPDAERIHAGLVAVDAGIGAVKASIHETLELKLQGCVLCLAAFPDGAVIKKRLLIHWWLAEDFVRSASEGNDRFNELVDKGFIVPSSPASTMVVCGTVHRCTSSGFSAAVRAICNIGHKYVELNDRWFGGKNKRKDLRVLQLGHWREFTTREQIADPMASHIEISGVERLRDMASSCKNLRYISFRGISGIESLPDSIGKLRQLLVLDLRACHNLEELGQGVTKLDRLQYLDLSECHLLIGVPRGLGQLTQLEILKGFVVANSNSNDLCHLNELTKLEKLRKLGIIIGKMAVPTEDEFHKLGEFKALQSLKIVWGVLTSVKNNGNTEASPLVKMKFALPPNLTKLDLHCFPFTDFAHWIRPTGVKKLYIRGGKLATLGDEEEWETEVLRLRFLVDLHCDHGSLRRSFSKLKPEKIEIHECPNFFCPGSNDVGESAECQS
ncbi:hypothetical protein QOZ80_9BG0717010 [Eleusine coracana subsp. coracana]|nr:hypothetical protein QOZ80_9BG0717010 [Eleusine coracana subsp. coracana]